MELNKNILAISILSATLVGCGGGSGGSSSNSNDDDTTAPVVTAPDATTPDFVTCNSDNTVCTLEGTIDEDFTLESGIEWRLNGFTVVGSGGSALADAAAVAAAKEAGVTLTIEPGVHVKAFSTGALLVTRGSKLMANGTADQPITFSSLQDEDFDGLGEWGGVIVQGFAPQFGPGNTGACFGEGTVCNVEGEGGDDVGNFGGNDPADDSGVIRYVRIAEGGKVAGPNNEINGLTLQGVGHGTTVEYVQVHNNLDDGVEWFGGTVNAKYLVLTGNDDDDIDFDEGYQGNIQYAIIRKNPALEAPTGSNDPRAIEANSSDEDYVPQTEGTLANITIIGSQMNKAEDNVQPGMRLRGSVTTRIYNSVVTNFDDCIRIDDSNTDGDDTTTGAGLPPGIDSASVVELENVIGACDDKFYAKRDADSEDGVVSMQETVTFDDAVAITEEVADNLEDVTFEPVDNGSGFAFTATDYIGAVEPGTSAAGAWWAGWTIPGSLDDVAETFNGNVQQGNPLPQ